MENQKSYDDQIEGRNAVLELLESGKDINKIYITKSYIFKYLCITFCKFCKHCKQNSVYK